VFVEGGLLMLFLLIGDGCDEDVVIVVVAWIVGMLV